jgi:hypothetical protein
MQDPVLRLARQRAQRLVEDSAAIELEFDNVRAWRPVLTIMLRLRDQAAEALSALAIVDPDEPKLIRRLQDKVQLFSDFVATAKQVYDAGIEAGDLLDSEEKEELRDLAGIDTDEERSERASTRDQSYDD